MTNRPESIRLLYDLSEEILQYEKRKKSKPKLQPEERRQKTFLRVSHQNHIFHGVMKKREVLKITSEATPILTI